MRTFLNGSMVVYAMAAVLATGCDIDKGDGDPDPTDADGTSQGEGDDSSGGSSSEGDTSAGPSGCGELGTARPCTLEGGEGGFEFCDGEQWGACVTPECTPGTTAACNNEVDVDTCDVVDGVPRWGCNVDPTTCACAGAGGSEGTPLVLSFDGAEPSYVADPLRAFDLDVVGACLATDWPSAATPWLALDRDGDGTIVDGRELFGSGTRLADGRRASHGFAALAELDGDGDGRITADDPRFAELRVWRDDDGDRRGVAGELLPLAAFGVLAIELEHDVAASCDARGNCGIERGRFTYVAAGGAVTTGAVVDVHLPCQ